MDRKWKVLKDEGRNREFLGRLVKVNDLKDALQKATLIVGLIEKYDQSVESTVGMSHENVNIILNGISEEPLSEKQWELAEEIDEAIKSVD